MHTRVHEFKSEQKIFFQSFKLFTLLVLLHAAHASALSVVKVIFITDYSETLNPGPANCVYVEDPGQYKSECKMSFLFLILIDQNKNQLNLIRLMNHTRKYF
jgi:hypothetical protein